MLKLVNIKKTYLDQKRKIEVFSNFSLKVNKGEFVAIFGPNGCGKTTLLNLIAGLDEPDFGQIIFDNPKTKIAFIFQNYRESLFPWLNVIDNISYPLKLQGISVQKRHAQVKNLCEQFSVQINFESYPYT